MSEHNDVRLEIEKEHEAIRHALDQIDRAREAASMRPLLEELCGLLETHFAREEAADGLHSAVGHRAPELLPGVHELFDEHREMTAEIERLVDQSVRLSELGAQLMSGVRDLTERLHQHEERENQLFIDASYNVHGAGD